MKTEAEIRQQLKKIEETKVALERVIGTSRAAPAVGITDITLGPMIAMLKWVLNDTRLPKTPP